MRVATALAPQATNKRHQPFSRLAVDCVTIDEKPEAPVKTVLLSATLEASRLRIRLRQGGFRVELREGFWDLLATEPWFGIVLGQVKR